MSSKDVIQDAVHEAVKPIASLEQEWSVHKLEGRISQYFRGAAKNLDFERPWDELVYQFADHVFSSIFSALPDRQWLNQVDLLQVMQVSIRELFPANLLAEVSPGEIEQTVLGAHDQAFEEQRFGLILHEVLSGQMKDKKSRSKLYTALEGGRKDAAAVSLVDSSKPAEDFASRWIACSIDRLRSACGGNPEYVLQQSQASWLFNSLIEQGAFPVSLLVASGQIPPSSGAVEKAVKDAYASGGGKEKGKSTNGNSSEATLRILAIYSASGNPAYNRNGSAKVSNGYAKHHPLCAQAEDCRGSPDDGLFRHMISERDRGDLYCATCWKLFSDGDPSLKGEPADAP